MGDSDEIQVFPETTYEQKGYEYSIDFPQTDNGITLVKRFCLQQGYTSFIIKKGKNNEGKAYFFNTNPKQIIEDKEYQRGTTLYIVPTYYHWKVFHNEDSCDGTYVDVRDFDGSERAIRICKFICATRHYGGFVVFREKAYFKASPCDKLLKRKSEFTGSTLYVAPPATPWAVYVQEQTKHYSEFQRDIERLHSEKVIRAKNSDELFRILSGGRDSVIKRGNLKHNSQALGIGLSRPMVDPVFDQLDRNHDERIDQREFSSHVPHRANDEDYLKIICDILGRPVPEHTILKTKPYREEAENPYFDSKVIALFKKLDVDSSGCIDEAEYKNFMRIMENRKYKHQEWNALAHKQKFNPHCMEIGHFAAIYGHRDRDLDEDLKRLEHVEEGFRILDERFKPYIKDKEHGQIILNKEQADLMDAEQKRLNGKPNYCFPTACCWCWILFLILLCNILTWVFGNLFDESSEYQYSLALVNAVNEASGVCVSDRSLLDDKWQIQYDSQTNYILNEDYSSDSYEVNFGNEKSEEERWVISVVISCILSILAFSTIWIFFENLIYDMNWRWPKLEHFGDTPENYVKQCREKGKKTNLGIYDMIYRPYFYLRVQELSQERQI